MTIRQRLKKYADLYFCFFRIGAVSFGGGYAALPIIEREVAEKRRWATVETLYDYYAIGQCTPGIILVNVSTFVGYTEGGLLGAVLATAGVVTPSLIVITLIAAFLQNFAHIPLVQKAFAGINAAVAALLTRAIWTFGKKSIKSAAGALLCLGAFGAVFFFKVNSAAVIFAGAVLGIALRAIKNRRALSKGKGSGDGPH